MMPASSASDRSRFGTPSDPVTDVIGTPCLNIATSTLIERLREWARREGTTAVDFTNTHITTMRHDDAAFAASLEAFDVFVPDSQVLYFAVRLLGGHMASRVYGPAFMAAAVPALGGPWTHYLLGGSEECVDRLRERLVAAVPDLRIVGSRNGYFDDAENPAIVEEINRLGPDFIWVGLGTPRQQEWIARHRDVIRRGVLLAVGFAFDVNAGMKVDSPAWLQSVGLGWLHRLSSEPTRLWRRYFVNNPRFLWRLLLQGSGLRDYSGQFRHRGFRAARSEGD